MGLSEALAHVKSKRPQAGPNSGFISQLQDFEKSLQGALSLYTSVCINLQIVPDVVNLLLLLGFGGPKKNLPYP